MSFELYYAGSHSSEAETFIKSNVSVCRLMSFVNDKSCIDGWVQHLSQKSVYNKLFMDSGAFSAKTQGIAIDVSQLVDRVNNIGQYLHSFANLDVIPDSTKFEDMYKAAEQGFQNFLYIQTHCKYAEKCRAVFHIGDPPEFLDRYIEYYKSHPQLKYFALGGMVGKNKDITVPFARSCCKKIKKELPEVKIHLFGFTSLSELPYIQCDSADSTKWLMLAANGCIITPYGNLSVSEGTKHKKDSVYNLTYTAYNKVKCFVEDLGFSLQELSTSYEKRDIFNIVYLQKWCAEYKYVTPARNKKSLI